MSKLCSKDISVFSLEGRFLGFNFEDGYKISAIADAILESGATERWVNVAN